MSGKRGMTHRGCYEATGLPCRMEEHVLEMTFTLSQDSHTTIRYVIRMRMVMRIRKNNDDNCDGSVIERDANDDDGAYDVNGSYVNNEEDEVNEGNGYSGACFSNKTTPIQ
ncbi:hypothetical protein PoB_003031000 [Plakobranchus ocellatus]|uniref:Uncharacterized protein n=1 Tax=Plakobranchus ocellatus TaxID=259542 RepID=A0AAV4A6K6_9GAST|nr:hypothetical protein PoB_003031000 [Plakobranchus ocellatus]